MGPPRRGLFALLVAVLAAGLPGPSRAQTYPSKAIDLIVPFAPGGSTGLTARALAQALEERWRVPVRVVNKPGGNTVPAVEDVMRAAPDGYTLLTDSPASSSMLDVVVKRLPWKVMDRTFLGMLAQTPMIFIAPEDSPFGTIGDAIARLKRDPATFTWTSLGGAGAQDFAFRQLAKAAGIEVTRTRPVVSKGGSEAVTMTAGGHVMLGSGSWSAVGPLLAAKKLKVLAVAAPERFPTIPDVPTMAELGMPSVNVPWWFSVSGPPGTPLEVIRAWDEALAAIAADPKVQAQLSTVGMVPYLFPAQRVRSMIEAERRSIEALWAP